MYFVVILAIFIHASPGAASIQILNDDCTKVPPLCHQLHSPKYTKMRLPNMLNHTRYEDVVADLVIWQPLLNSSKCNANNQLKFFLCVTYAPVCVDKFIAPCKSLCKSVRDSCDPVMRQHNYSWPKFFNCNQPKKFFDESSRMCISLKILGQNSTTNCWCKQPNRQKLKILICQSNFVLRGWVTKNNKHLQQIEVKISDIFRQKNSQKRILKRTTLTLQYVSKKKRCRCNKLSVSKKTKGSERYLIIGHYVSGDKMQLDAIKSMRSYNVVKKWVKKCP